jgi:DNA-directed RNA polymerase specialized sigma24 family protein
MILWRPCGFLHKAREMSWPAVTSFLPLFHGPPQSVTTAISTFAWYRKLDATGDRTGNRAAQIQAPDSTEQALRLLQDTVFSFTMRVCQQREDAEDTMQEVLAVGLVGYTAFDVITILRQKYHQKITGYEVRVEADQAERPQVLTAVRIHHALAGFAIDPVAVEEAIRLSEGEGKNYGLIATCE